MENRLRGDHKRKEPRHGTGRRAQDWQQPLQTGHRVSFPAMHADKVADEWQGMSYLADRQFMTKLQRSAQSAWISILESRKSIEDSQVLLSRLSQIPTRKSGA